MNNSQIGEMLGITRERVRQILEQYQPPDFESSDEDVAQLVAVAQALERHRLPNGRVTDRRTLRKRVVAALAKQHELVGRGCKDEGTYSEAKPG